MVDVKAIVVMHSILVHTYANDTQLYTSHSAADHAILAIQLLCCIDDISYWMCSNRPKLDDKTQFIWLGAVCISRASASQQVQLVVGSVPVSTADNTVTDLSVTLDTRMSFQQVLTPLYVAASTSHDSCDQCDDLFQKTLCALLYVFITSRIDYCNAVLYSISATVTHQLWAVSK